jgi:hypothetical protein
MRVFSANTTKSQGNTLMTTLVIMAIIGVSLATYLNLVQTQQEMTTRSQVWNSCMPAVEAGIEEALTHLYKNYVTNMTDSNWELVNGRYVKTNAVIGRSSGGGFPSVTPANPPGTPAKPAWGHAVAYGYYAVDITTNIPYIVTSKGFFPLPGATPASIDKYLSRTVRVTTQNLGMFMGPMVIKGAVDLKGNNIKTDSYDSRDPNKSTGGNYDPLKAGDKGDIITLGGVGDDIGNADVWGHVYTSPAGTVKTGPNGRVGSVGWQMGTTNGIQPGWWQKDLNISFPDVTEPFSAAAPPPTVLGVTILNNGNFLQNWQFGGKVLVTGDATLYVKAAIKFTGADNITIAPGARLTIYCSGATALFGDIFNPNTDPTSFMYFGLPSNTTLEVKGATHHACFYAPQADFELKGNGEVYGCVAANNAKLSGNAAIHYDEALINRTPSRGFIVASWNEL